MNNTYKEKVAFEIIFGSILKEENSNNLFYNCRRMDKSFVIPKNLSDEKLCELIRKSINDKYDYIYELVKDSPANDSTMGVTD